MIWQRKLTVLLPIVAGLLAAAWVTDRWLTRDDRVRIATAADDRLSVQDALLHYQLDVGALPEKLNQLTPAYLRTDQLTSPSSEPLYSYSAATRLLQYRTPFVVTGLFPRRHHLAPLILPSPGQSEADLAGQLPAPAVQSDLWTPDGPALPPPPADAFVFEAEYFSATNYGWEVRADAASAAGAYLHSKEGVGNGPGQTRDGVFDFHNIREGKDVSKLVYHFNLPKSGKYYIYGRMWTTASHCSNTLYVGIDEGGPVPGQLGTYHGDEMSNTTPFRWVWTQVGKHPYTLAQGDHSLHVSLHEDGIRLDQFILTPTRLNGNQAFTANMLPNKNTAFRTSAAPPVDLLFDVTSVVMSPDAPPAGNLVVRRIRAEGGPLELKVELRAVGAPPADTILASQRTTLADLPELAFLPLDFSRLDLSNMARREYLLVAQAQSGDTVIAERALPMVIPFEWEVAGPFDYFANGTAGPLDGALEKLTPELPGWVPFACRNLTPFGVLDFGLHTTGNSLHAPEWKTIYARTHINVSKTGIYLLKLQSDDQMVLWLDGEQIYRHDRTGPVTRSVARIKQRLTQGRHTFKMRVNQAGLSQWRDGRWQASLRIRTTEDTLSNVIGIPPTSMRKKEISSGRNLAENNGMDDQN